MRDSNLTKFMALIQTAVMVGGCCWTGVELYVHIIERFDKQDTHFAQQEDNLQNINKRMDYIQKDLSDIRQMLNTETIVLREANHHETHAQ